MQILPLFVPQWRSSPMRFTQGILCLAVCAWAVWLCGFAAAIPQKITIGGDIPTRYRGLDEPFLSGFWAAEPAEWDASTQTPYRWTSPAWAIHWPAAGNGFFVSSTSVDASPWDNPSGAAMQWVTPALGTQLTQPGKRRLAVLLRGDGTNAHIDLTMKPLQTSGDRRALGIIVREIALFSTSTSWRPLQLGMLFVFCGLTYVWSRSWRLTNPAIWVAASAFLISMSWLHDPLWWMVHTIPILYTLGIASIAGLAIIFLMLPDTLDFVRWWWVVSVAIFVPLLATQSPYMHTSDSAMHVRMLFDVMRGNVYQLAELPCEASALTVPYPPLTYLLAAPFSLLTWDRVFASNILIAGAQIAHVTALVYLGRITCSSRRILPVQIFFLFLAAWSMPFLQSVHIGELSNAWGHVLFIVAIAVWLDEDVPGLMKAFFFFAALTVHTGVALSFGLTICLLLAIELWQNQRIPWRMAALGIGSVLGAVIFYYSVYGSLIGQPLKYPGCPPHIPVLVRMALVPTTLPVLFVAIAGCGACVLPSQRIKNLFWAGGIVTLLSISVLLMRDQTVRWGMAFYPFGALAGSIFLASLGRFGRIGRIFRFALIGAILSLLVVQLWERIYSYLH